MAVGILLHRHEHLSLKDFLQITYSYQTQITCGYDMAGEHFECHYQDAAVDWTYLTITDISVTVCMLAFKIKRQKAAY